MIDKEYRGPLFIKAHNCGDCGPELTPDEQRMRDFLAYCIPPDLPAGGFRIPSFVMRQIPDVPVSELIVTTDHELDGQWPTYHLGTHKKTDGSRKRPSQWDGCWTMNR